LKVTGNDIPIFLVEIGPHHLSRLVGRATHFLRDPTDATQPVASIEIVSDGVRLVPTAFESHTKDGVFGRVARTREAGVCMACLDRSGRYIAFILVDEVL
jgi:hypothetical protein